MASPHSKLALPDDSAVDLLSSPHLAPLPRAFLRGEHHELLAPLRLVGLDEALRPRAAPDVVVRERLAASLAARNRELAHPRATELAERLAQPATQVVVTGQQPGLFGGPLYSLTKAVAAARVAAALEERGTPAVAVFWMASEDHDFREMAHASMGALGTISLGEDPDPLRPMGQRRLGPSVASLLEQLSAEASPLQRPFLERLQRWYRPEALFQDAFARLLVDLLEERCPLLLDALDPTLKELERPALRRLVERRTGVAEALEAACAQVEAVGFDLQVKPRAGASPLFVLHDGARRCVEWDGPDAYRLRGLEQSRPVAELLELAEDRPAALSPGVLARPVVQDAVLGTGLQVLGPGELSYMAQAAALYPVLEVTAPDVALRPQVLLALPRERERLGWLAERGVSLATLLGGAAELDRCLAAAAGPDEVRPMAAQFDAQLVELGSRLVELESQLERPWEKTRQQIARALESLASRADAAAARQDETLRSRVERLRQSLLPEGRLQERVLSVAWAAALFGESVGRHLYTALELDERKVQVVTLAADPTGEPTGEKE